MGKLMILISSTVFLDSCSFSTPMERAQNICNQMRNPSPACVERQYNKEIAWLDEHHRRLMENTNNVISQQPTESEYDKRIREFDSQAKDRCESNGEVFKKYGSGWTCEKPETPPAPRENKRCRNYSQRAIQQYQEATSPRAKSWGCDVQTSARWTPNYQTHYNWCQAVQDARLHSEERARVDYLSNCNRPPLIDQGTNVLHD